VLVSVPRLASRRSSVETRNRHYPIRGFQFLDWPLVDRPISEANRGKPWRLVSVPRLASRRSSTSQVWLWGANLDRFSSSIGLSSIVPRRRCGAGFRSGGFSSSIGLSSIVRGRTLSENRTHSGFSSSIGLSSIVLPSSPSWVTRRKRFSSSIGLSSIVHTRGLFTVSHRELFQFLDWPLVDRPSVGGLSAHCVGCEFQFLDWPLVDRPTNYQGCSGNKLMKFQFLDWPLVDRPGGHQLLRHPGHDVSVPRLASRRSSTRKKSPLRHRSSVSVPRLASRRSSPDLPGWTTFPVQAVSVPRLASRRSSHNKPRLGARADARFSSSIGLSSIVHQEGHRRQDALRPFQFLDWPLVDRPWHLHGPVVA